MDRTVRIERYQNYAFGLFLHWGLYSCLSSGEWALRHRKLHQPSYNLLTEKFDARDFNPRSIVKLAREAGMRYICLTTRHHDGFSLYDTKGLNTFDAPHSAAGRDLIGEFADACHEDGMRLFFYHTTLDWWDSRFVDDWDGYLKYLRASIELLCTNYGKVDGFWFDGNWSHPDRDWQEDELYATIRSCQPDCIIINNSSIGALGQIGHPELDVVTFEQGKPTASICSGNRPLAAEMCETITSHWGVADKDFSAKSPAELIQTLVECRRFGANLLLNAGLTATGEMPAYESAVLRMIGRWVGLNGHSLYTGRPTDLKCHGGDFVLSDGDEYYYFTHRLPIHGNTHLSKGETGEGWKTISGTLPQIKQIEWVDNGESLRFTQSMEHGLLSFEATEYPYGEQQIVRVARISAV